MPDLAAELDLALELADLADARTTARFQAADLHVQHKPDGSPVSDADFAVERLLREHLAAQRPGHAVLGEEAGQTGDGPWRWILDPIDGTSHYVVGDPGWSTLIALEHEGDVVVGVASMPALGRRLWAARDLGVFRDGSRLAVSRTDVLADAVVHDDWTRSATAGLDGEPATRLAGAAGRLMAEPGDGLLAVAEGRADVCATTSGQVWDFAPAIVIVEEAGGTFTDLSGRRRIDGDEALVSNGHLHAAALAALR